MTPGRNQAPEALRAPLAISCTPDFATKALLRAMPLCLPVVVRWASQQEQKILRTGVALDPLQLIDARLMGVTRPDKIRLLNVDQVPLPANRFLRWAAKRTRLISTNTAGMALRYGIFIRSDCWQTRRLIAHECVHTAQYERLGGIEEFLSLYLRECLEVGYRSSPLEQEALLKSQLIGWEGVGERRS
jgi:hypothetical protein